MSDMKSIYSPEYHEEICFYPDDLNYSWTILGCGYESGKPYDITFDEEGNPVEIIPIN